jgi:succinate dehydrogenase / fumarate reductase cytochrome b subunit
MSITNRPMSPHLQVYRPQFTSILSIANRITGVALSAGTVVLVGQLFAAANGAGSFASFQHFVGSWFGLFILVGWSFSLFFHLCNGIRHLVWDFGIGLDLETAYKTGNWVLIGSVALTALTWVGVILHGGH